MLAVAPAAASRYIPPTGIVFLQRALPMRAEIQAVVDEIKQSIGLLRRHL